MRLIDADKLIEVLHESLEGDCDLRKDYEFMGIDEFIENQPTAYDVDKVIAQLDEKIARLDSRQQICYEVGDFKTGDKMADKMAAFIESKNIVKREVKK
jgi:hypothetical protein